MTPIAEPVRLGIITGPIAAGKSTVAEAVADRLTREGWTVALVDVDEVARMVRSPAADARRMWDEGHRAHAKLIAAWLTTSVDVVLAVGALFTDFERGTLEAALPGGVPTRRILLHVPFEVALARVADDPTRGLSRDPGFLRSTHDRFADATVDRSGWDRVIDTATSSLDQTVDEVLRLLTR